MQSKLENLSETQDGARFVMEADCLGTHVTVVTAYDGNHDDWPYHVYLQKGDKPRQRLTERPTTRRGATKLSALEQGLLLAANVLIRSPKTLSPLSPLRPLSSFSGFGAELVEMPSKASGFSQLHG